MKTPSSPSTPGVSTGTGEVTPKKILVADDEPTILLGIEYSLTTEGFDVETVEDGEKAISRLINQSDEPMPDAAILDLRMPGADGMEVVRRLVENERRIPTVIASAYIDSPTAVEALDLGVVDFLRKPVTPNEIRGVISKMLDEEKNHAEALTSSDLTDDSAAPPESEAVAVARCLLRRRRWSEAASYLQRCAPKGGSEASLWLMLAEHLQFCHADESDEAESRLASRAFYEAANVLDFLAYQEN